MSSKPAGELLERCKTPCNGGLLAAEAKGKQYSKVVIMSLHACVGMQNDDDLVNHDRGMGGWRKDG